MLVSYVCVCPCVCKVGTETAGGHFASVIPWSPQSHCVKNILGDILQPTLLCACVLISGEHLFTINPDLHATSFTKQIGHIRWMQPQRYSKFRLIKFCFRLRMSYSVTSLPFAN